MNMNDSPQCNNSEAAVDTTAGRYGTIAFLSNDPVIGRSLREYGEWAQAEIELLRGFLDAGAVALDVGAFIGTHVLALAEKVGVDGRVHGFEPVPDHFNLLQRNIVTNSVGNDTLHNVGLADVAGECGAKHHDPTSAANFGGTTLSRSVQEGQYPIPVTTLDALQLPRCDRIKIDAEGMEADVLRGGKEMLAKFRPIVYAECNSMDKAWPCVLFMREHDYETYFFLFDAYSAMNFRSNPNDFFGWAREAGLLFVPMAHEKKTSVRAPTGTIIFPVSSLDCLALGLLRKPQYKGEVLALTAAAKVLGTNFFANEIELANLKYVAQKNIAELVAQLESERKRNNRTTNNNGL